jgi:peptide/nickel transport system substrate-binding protein
MSIYNDKSINSIVTSKVFSTKSYRSRWCIFNRELVWLRSITTNGTEVQSPSSLTPKHGGTIRLGLIGGQQSGSLDPHLSTSSAGITRGFAIYNKLWEWDENMLPRLALAEFAEPNHNASEWTIRLRKGLEFHHGKTMTADDVIFSVKRLTDPKLASLFRNLVQWIDRDRIQKIR